MRILTFIILFTSFSSWAAPHAIVSLVRGDVTYEGVKLTKDKVIKANGLLKIGEKSFLKLRVQAYNSVMTFGPKTEMKISFKKDEYKVSPYTLVRGKVRWVSQGKAKYKGGIRTKSVVMGVRGTDFLAIANSDFGESEIVCFDGQVLLENRDLPYNKFVISKGQWGGLGGRYGKLIEKPLNLSSNIVEQMKGVVKLD